MSYSATTIANEFIKLSLLAGDPQHEVTNMKLQKLVYIAHGYSLGLALPPLIYNDIHAFEWGPVIPVLYKQLKEYKADKVDKLIPNDAEVLPAFGAGKMLVDKVWAGYGSFDGLDLSRITHKPDTPWSKTWAVNKHGIIQNDLIRDYYSKLLHERRGISPATI